MAGMQAELTVYAEGGIFSENTISEIKRPGVSN